MTSEKTEIIAAARGDCRRVMRGQEEGCYDQEA